MGKIDFWKSKETLSTSGFMMIIWHKRKAHHRIITKRRNMNSKFMWEIRSRKSCSTMLKPKFQRFMILIYSIRRQILLTITLNLGQNAWTSFEIGGRGLKLEIYLQRKRGKYLWKLTLYKEFNLRRTRLLSQALKPELAKSNSI